jgi:carbon-monoxide dehydrogenase medium subunit
MKGNTRILRQRFEYLEPETIQEAAQLLDQYGSEARILAGGTDLLVQLKRETVSASHLINIRKIPGLSYIKEAGWLRIGAATRLSEVLQFCLDHGKYAALCEALQSLGKVQVRNMGTIGGNLCNASPAADTAPPLLVFDSRVKLLNVGEERIVGLEDFFKGVNITTMAPNEIMTEIEIPSVKNSMGSAFMKIVRVGVDLSKISCAVAVERHGELCARCRIAMGAVAPVPMRMNDLEEILVDKKVDASLIEEIGQKVAEEIEPITDVRSSAEYRRQIAPLLLKDVFWKAWGRAGGEEEG